MLHSCKFVILAVVSDGTVDDFLSSLKSRKKENVPRQRRKKPCASPTVSVIEILLCCYVTIICGMALKHNIICLMLMHVVYDN